MYFKKYQKKSRIPFHFKHYLMAKLNFFINYHSVFKKITKIYIRYFEKYFSLRKILLKGIQIKFYNKNYIKP